MRNWAIIIVPVSLLIGNNQLVSADILKITVPEVVVSAGKRSVIKIEIEIRKGYHIQANKINDDLLIPTVIEITEDKNISITDWHGRVVQHATTREFPTFVALQGLPSGSYTVSVRLRDGTLLAAKQLAVME